MKFHERPPGFHITLRSFIFFSSLLTSLLSFTCGLGIIFFIYMQANPLSAGEECLPCHTSVRKGDVHGAVMIRQEMAPVITESWNKIMVLFLLFSPLPVLLAGGISRFVNF